MKYVAFKDLKIKKSTRIAGIIRGRKTIIPSGEDCMLSGDKVIVETVRGIECGEVAMDNRDINEEEIVNSLNKCKDYLNSEEVLGQTNEELTRADGLKTISEDAFGVLKGFLMDHKGLGGRVDKRIIII